MIYSASEGRYSGRIVQADDSDESESYPEEQERNEIAALQPSQAACLIRPPAS